MIHDTIATLENRIQNAAGLGDLERGEMLVLISTLKSETNPTAAVQPQSVRGAFQGFTNAIESQEVQHPQITELVNSISQVLSNTGI